MIRAKVLGRKYSKRLSKPDLEATFYDVSLVKTELSNDVRVVYVQHLKPCSGLGGLGDYRLGGLGA